MPATATNTETTAPRGLFASLRARFAGSGAALGGGLRQLFTGQRFDAALLETLEARLLGADIGVEATEQVLQGLQQRAAASELANADALLLALRAELVAILKPCQRSLTIDRSHRPHVMLIVGVNGSGKTTSIGKLAQRLAQQGHGVTLAAGDTFRAAAVEQLQVWAKRVGAEFVGQATGADPAALIFDSIKSAAARGCEVLIADTAGRLQNQAHLMEELKKIKRVMQRAQSGAPHDVLLVLDANQGQNALAQARQFHAALGLTGLIITKLDGTAKGGIVVAIAQQLALPVYFLGLGEQPGDLGEFDAGAYADALVGAAT